MPQARPYAAQRIRRSFGCKPSQPHKRFLHDITIAALLGLANPLCKRKPEDGDARRGCEVRIQRVNTALAAITLLRRRANRRRSSSNTSPAAVKVIAMASITETVDGVRFSAASIAS